MARGASRSLSELPDKGGQPRESYDKFKQALTRPVAMMRGRGGGNVAAVMLLDRGIVEINEYFGESLRKPISMTEADRVPDTTPLPWGSKERFYEKNGKLTVLSENLTDFKNDPNDPESLHATMEWRKNSFESLAFFTPDGKRFHVSKGDDGSVGADIDDANKLTTFNGITVHNHPGADITFSGPDLMNWLELNHEEMIVVSPKYAYSIRHSEKSRNRPVGRPDRTDFPVKVVEEYEQLLYNAEAVADTKLQVGRHGWIRTNKLTGESKRVYGDMEDPPRGIVAQAHMERCMNFIADKYGFKYNRYPIPK